MSNPKPHSSLHEDARSHPQQAAADGTERRAPGQEIFLHPGDCYFGRAPQRVRTLLGSCVAVTLWHRGLQAGGICHYLLAIRNAASGPHRGALSGRYGDEALLMLLRSVLAYGRPVKEYEAMLVGGASVLSAQEKGLSLDVPSRNIDMARQLARQLGLNVQAEDLGGGSPRLLLFDLATGEVWVRHSQDGETPADTRKKT